MAIFYSDYINKIKQNKAKLEKALKVKISFSGRNIFIESIDENVIDEYVAEQVIEAINLSFTIEKALLLCNEDFILEKINIKDLTKRRDLNVVRARIIGTKGKTKNLIENLSDCFISIHSNTIGIIGRAEDIKKAIAALTSLIHGAKQSRVYGYLERERTKEKLKINEDLGLKKQNKKP